MENLDRTLAAKIDSLKNYTVNSIDTVNSNNKSSNTVNSDTTVTEKINNLLKDIPAKDEWLANQLAEGLNDAKSRPYFRILAHNSDQGRLLEALSITKEAYQQGKLRSTKAKYFMGILRKWKFQTKFKKS